MQQPVREIEVRLDTPSLYEVCKNTVDYLQTVGKVAPGEGGTAGDVDNLVKVMKAQAATKIAIARRSNGKLVEICEAEYSSRVEKRFTVLPKVANAYLENIGQFECDGQVFVPKRLPSLHFVSLVEGLYMTTYIRNGPGNVREVAIASVNANQRQAYVQGKEFTGDPFTMVTNGHDTLVWERIDSIGDFRNLCEWYEKFISKCNRKAGALLQNVVFAKGEGKGANSTYGERHTGENLCI